MLNQNILIAARDFVASGTCLNPESFIPGFGPENYKSKKMWLFSRFDDTAVIKTYVEEDLGGSRSLNLFGVLKHNLGSLARWRIRAADTRENLTASPVYDSGWLDVAPYDGGLGVLDWGEFEWGSRSGYEDLEGLNRHMLHAAAEQVTARYLRYDFDDTAQVGSRIDNYLQFARLWASTAYQPSLNMLYGAEIIPVDSTEEEDSRSQVTHFSPLVVKHRELVASFNDLTKTELMLNIFGPLFLQLGKSGEVIVLLSPLEPSLYPYESIYGRLKELNPVKYRFHNRVTSSLIVKESV